MAKIMYNHCLSDNLTKTHSLIFNGRGKGLAMRVGQVELRIQRNVQYTGRRCRIGRICFDENDRMVVQVGYCPDCRGKIVMSLPSARSFANSYSEERRRISARIARRIAKRNRL